MDTHNLRIETGKHKGELYTRLPRSYLRWMIRAKHSSAAIAEAELARRGDSLPDIEVSGHAVDRASLYRMEVYHRLRADEGEGLHSFLARVAHEALKLGEVIDPPDRVTQVTKVGLYGMLFVIDLSGAWPSIKTLMLDERRKAA